MVILKLLVCAVSISYATGLFRVYPRIGTRTATGPSGKPLFLTPYIENNRTEEGKHASQVKPFISNIKSYSGFFTVNKTHNSNHFFWFFPSELKPEKAPLLLWLQGGPGASSLFGLFAEIGPYYINKEQKVKLRKHYWSQMYNVLYIDNPVGTGFSFTDNDEGYTRNEEQIGEQLHSTLTQFFKIFPEYLKNDFYITGESYAGKYIPALGHTIHEKNPKAEIKINLKGLAIGNGWCDPVTQINYADYLYQLGIIDTNGRKLFHQKQNHITKLINEKKMLEAFYALDNFIDGDLTSTKTLFYNLTGFNYYMNFLSAKDDSTFGDMGKYLEKAKVRKHIHVGNTPFRDENPKVESFLKVDSMESVKPWVEVLIEHYKLLIYNGQLDIIVAYPLTVDFLQSLKWSGENEYKKAERKIWLVGNDVAGYTKTVKNFTEALVRDAGHTVPTYQPVWMMDLLSRFISGENV